MSALSRDTVYAFLLGALDDDAAEALEARLFEDDAVHEEVGALEAELIDDYLAGGLEPEQRRRFEARYLTEPEPRARVAAAEALRRAANAAPAPEAPPPSPWQSLLEWLRGRGAGLGLPLAAAVALLAVGLGVGLGGRSEPGGRLRLTLTPDVVRAADGPARLELTPGVEAVELELALDGVPISDRAQVRLRRGGAVVGRYAPAQVSDLAVQFSLPSADLVPGLNTVELYASSAEEAPLLATYSLRVEAAD